MINDRILKKAHYVYHTMKTRCNNPNFAKYKNYGAKGIKVEISKSDFIRWYVKELTKFEETNFSEEKPSVGRIDHSKNYSLNNIEMISVSKNSLERHSRIPSPIIAKPVQGTNKITGRIRVFHSFQKAEWMTGITRPSVRNICENKHKNGLYYDFKYVKE